MLNTQDECPESAATAPEPGFPEDDVRTSCRIRRLSSEAERRSCNDTFKRVIGKEIVGMHTWPSRDQARERTGIECEVYVETKAFDWRSNIYI